MRYCVIGRSGLKYTERRSSVTRFRGARDPIVRNSEFRRAHAVQNFETGSVSVVSNDERVRPKRNVRVRSGNAFVQYVVGRGDLPVRCVTAEKTDARTRPTGKRTITCHVYTPIANTRANARSYNYHMCPMGLLNLEIFLLRL